jgi:DNA-binding beta-propeller fold protein YncE
VKSTYWKALCAAVLALALVPPGAGAAAGHQLVGTITGERIGKFEQIKGACGVAVDSDKNVYVADYYQNRVVVFNEEWKLLTKITGINPFDADGVAPIDGPCDLAVDSAGNLYVNNYHREVVRYTPAQFPPQEGTAYGSRTVIDSNHSTGVAVDPATDRVYVDDRTYVAVYEPSGAPVEEAGNPLRIGEGSLLDGYGVAVSGFEGDAQYPTSKGDVYVGDAATETVKVYDPALDLDQPQLEIRGEGTEEGRFYLTDTDLAVDPEDGHLYVSNNLEPHFEERPEAVVDELSPAGYYRGSVPDSFTNGFPSFLQAGEPTGLAVAANGVLYVTSGNYENAAVFAFGPPEPFETRLLSVAKMGAGTGTVTSIPAAISCGPVCAGEFDFESTVVLKATPAPGSQFAGWAPGGCDSEPSPGRCAVEMSADRAVTAEFAPAPEGAALGPPVGQSSAGQASATQAPPPPSATVKRKLAQRHYLESVQKGNLRVSLSGRISPNALPRSGAAPVSVFVGGRISTTDGSELPQLKGLRIEFNRGGRLEDRGLPVCPLQQINIASSARALSACRSALVGTGSFEANIVLRGQDPYPTTGRLLVFNGRKGGKEVLFGHIYSSEPFATSFVITFKIAHRAKGTFGTVLTASLPEALGNWGYVTAIEMKLSRRYSAGGERRSFLSAGCPAPKGFPGAVFTLARTSFSFAGGKTLSSGLTRDCKVR